MEFRTFLDEITQSAAEFLWLPQDFLTRHGLKTDYELRTYAANFPFWRPEPQISNIFRISSAKAFGAGWRTWPTGETAGDYMAIFGVLQGISAGWRDYLSRLGSRLCCVLGQRTRHTVTELTLTMRAGVGGEGNLVVAWRS